MWYDTIVLVKGCKLASRGGLCVIFCCFSLGLTANLLSKMLSKYAVFVGFLGCFGIGDMVMPLV